MFKHILVPVAPGHTEEVGRAMKTAAKLMDDGGTLSVLSVIEAIPTYVDAYIPPEYMDGRVEQVTAEMQAAFATEKPGIHVTRGHPANMILTWSKDAEVDCIVMPSHQPGFADYLLGSTAARVVRHAQCSVVVLR